MSQSSAPHIDPRGPRFTAGVTLALLAIALVTPTPIAVTLVAVQAVFFTIGAWRGVQFTPTAWVFRRLIRPRLSSPTELEDARPPRFAQSVGLAFLVVALLGYASGVTIIGQIAVGFAVAAAFLNAVFGFCLGCELYLLIKRITPSPHESTDNHDSETVQSNNKKEAIA